jgi:hypothetical protein
MRPKTQPAFYLLLSAILTAGSVGGDLLFGDSENAQSNGEIGGGVVGGSLIAKGSSRINISGGSVDGELLANDIASIILSRSNFMVDGERVPRGDLAALSGTLTGDLVDGGSVNNHFLQGGYAAQYTGTITLIPEPSTAVLLSLGLTGLAAGRRRLT